MIPPWPPSDAAALAAMGREELSVRLAEAIETARQWARIDPTHLALRGAAARIEALTRALAAT